MFFVCFLMKMCSMMVFFITILFDSLFSLFSYLSLALVRYVVRSRFTKIHTKNYCSTECVCVFYNCVYFCDLVYCSLFWMCICDLPCVCVVLLQYQIANMVQISQINLICFLLPFFVKIHYDFSFLLLLFCVWLLCII